MTSAVRVPTFANGSTVRGTGDYYDDFSAWDTFRALHPLYTIIDPDRDATMVQSLIAKGEEGGFLPIFPMWGSYTSAMIGDHLTAIIGDAYFKGIPVDMTRAYPLMRQSAFQSPPTVEQYKDGMGRRALDDYLKLGYVPLENGVPDAFHRKEQVSRTLGVCLRRLRPRSHCGITRSRGRCRHPDKAGRELPQRH